MRISYPAGMRKPAVCLSLSGINLYFSYHTLVAFQWLTVKLRTEKKYSPTTSTHMSTMGVSHFFEVSQNELENLADTIVNNNLKDFPGFDQDSLLYPWWQVLGFLDILPEIDPEVTLRRSKDQSYLTSNQINQGVFTILCDVLCPKELHGLANLIADTISFQELRELMKSNSAIEQNGKTPLGLAILQTIARNSLYSSYRRSQFEKELSTYNIPRKTVPRENALHFVASNPDLMSKLLKARLNHFVQIEWSMLDYEDPVLWVRDRDNHVFIYRGSLPEELKALKTVKLLEG